MKMNKLTAVALAAVMLLPAQALADKYIIDTKGSHAFIQFPDSASWI